MTIASIAALTIGIVLVVGFIALAIRSQRWGYPKGQEPDIPSTAGHAPSEFGGGAGGAGGGA